MREDLTLLLKTLIIETLNLEDVEPADLEDDEPLIGTGLGLDSIDALELVVGVEKTFSIKIKNSEEARSALQNIATLAQFIRERQAASA